LFSKNIAGSFRNASQKLGVKMLLLKEVNHLILMRSVANAGVGCKTFSISSKYVRIKTYLRTLPRKTIYIEKSSWIRAKYSGLLHDHHTIGTFVKKEGTY
jgi:hypothetical protein